MSDEQQFPADVTAYVRAGNCVCDLCLRPTWQCGECTIPDQIQSLIAADQPEVRR